MRKNGHTELRHMNYVDWEFASMSKDLCLSRLTVWKLIVHVFIVLTTKSTATHVLKETMYRSQPQRAAKASGRGSQTRRIFKHVQALHFCMLMKLLSQQKKVSGHIFRRRFLPVSGVVCVWCLLNSDWVRWTSEFQQWTRYTMDSMKMHHKFCKLNESHQLFQLHI